jgi:hypothetical protein
MPARLVVPHFRASAAALRSSSSGISVPVNPRASAATNAQALAASTIDTSIRPSPGMSSTFDGLPLGSNFPV